MSSLESRGSSPESHARALVSVVAGQHEDNGAVGAPGSTVVITGDVTASEDLTLDGQVTGTIELTEHVLTIGATGRVTGRICARIVTIRGSVTGSVTAREKVDIRATGSLDGDVIAPRIALVDGGYFHGTVKNSLRVSDHPSTGHSTRTT